MNPLFSFSLLFPLVAAAVLSGCQTTHTHHDASVSPAADPVTRSVEQEWMSLATWYRMHADDVAVAKDGGVDVLFLGDSITESWDWQQGHDRVFDEYFGQYKTANFGIGGDQTQHLLWRLQNGAHGQLDPKVVVLKIGVNNFNHSNHSAADVAAGVEAILAQVRQNFPNARVLLHGVLPFEESGSSGKRQLVQDTNARLAKLADGEQVVFYDFGEIFLDEQGNIPSILMEDFLHPSAEGMRRFAEKIQPVVADWLQP